MDAVVVGAGAAGLATAAALRARGVEPLVLEAGEGLGRTWQERYDRLHLHTPRWQSGLPGHRIPRRYGQWVPRDAMVEYLRDYAAHHGIRPHLGTTVERVEQRDRGWALRLDDGSELLARHVVVATGLHRVPVVPQWPGVEHSPIEVKHSHVYRSPRELAGRDVLVVGSGNTGAEIAADLAESGSRRVWWAVRTPPHVIPRRLGPVPTTTLGILEDSLPAAAVDPVNRLLARLALGDLTRYGLPAPTAGLVAQARATGVTPTIDVGVVAALRSGRVTVVAPPVSLDGGDVRLQDGSVIRPDVVVAATGYRPGLEHMLGHLGVLDRTGRPVVGSAPATGQDMAALHFVGFRAPLKGVLLQIRIDALATATAIKRSIRPSNSDRRPGETSDGTPVTGGAVP